MRPAFVVPRAMLHRGRLATKLSPMMIARTLAELRAECASLRATHGTLALVPTMGALHDGHRALVRAAAASGAGVVASIFVNPLQFGANEDLSRYPRDEVGDLAALEDAGCQLTWLPDVSVMYPADDATTIVVTGPAEGWEGDARPGHFRGVATVCAKLFGQVQPDRAYFGEKDWQQLQVVRRMAADLHLPLEIVGVPTVRETDGLALSSRNRFLTDDERRHAPRLHSVLNATSRALAAGGPAEQILADARSDLTRAGFAVDYLALVDGPTLTALPVARPGSRLVAAVRLGAVRLIDNMAMVLDTAAQ
jgi:pantoate--beta-alanine ligase